MDEALSNNFMGGVRDMIHGTFFNACLWAIKNKIDLHERMPRLKKRFYARLDGISLISELDGFREKLTRYHKDLP